MELAGKSKKGSGHAYRSAASGKHVAKKHAERSPKATVREGRK